MRIVRIVLWLAFVYGLSVSSASAQQATTVTKDRKDFLIEVQDALRNEATGRLIACAADSNIQIAELKRQLDATRAELDAAKRALDDAKAKQSPQQ